eukprot:90640-Hanusia_phi.AAC.7
MLLSVLSCPPEHAKLRTSFGCGTSFSIVLSANQGSGTCEHARHLEVDVMLQSVQGASFLFSCGNVSERRLTLRQQTAPQGRRPRTWRTQPSCRHFLFCFLASHHRRSTPPGTLRSTYPLGLCSVQYSGVPPTGPNKRVCGQSALYSTLHRLPFGILDGSSCCAR